MIDSPYRRHRDAMARQAQCLREAEQRLAVLEESLTKILNLTKPDFSCPIAYEKLKKEIRACLPSSD